MRILFYQRWVGVHHGGTETHVKSLVNEFYKRGHEISILTRQGRQLSDLDPAIKVWRVSKNFLESDFSYENPLLLYFHTGLFMVKSFLYLLYLTLVKGQRFDVVSVHFVTESLVVRLYRRLTGTPFLFVLEGYTPLEAREAKKANVAIAISQSMVDTISQKHGYAPKFLPVGIDEKVFNEKVDGSAERGKYLSGFERLILTVGRIEPRKDYPTLIEAAKIIKDGGHRFRFLIVGDGIDRAKIKKLIGDSGLADEVLLLGATSETRKAQLYRAADLFVLPTLYEGFGIVFAEALACGLPIVSTKVGAVPEVVDGAGVLVEPHNAEALATAIVKVLEDDDLRQRLSSTALKISQKYHWSNLVGEYEEIYLETLNNKSQITSSKQISNLKL